MTVDHSMMKLGAKPPRIDRRTLKLADYMGPQLPPPPQQANFSQNLTEWGMLLNDQLGDCTIAGVAHAIMVWSLNAVGAPVHFTDEDVLDYYEKWDGYVPDDPDTDQGGVELDVLNNWRKNGFVGHQLAMHAEVNTKKRAEIVQAMWLCGGLYSGLALPITAQKQNTWHVDPDAGADGEPGSWGGHCLVPGTRVLTDDLRWIPIESLSAGDALVGFDEFPSGSRARNYRRSVVEEIVSMRLPCFDLAFDDGTEVRCSFDHMWLVENGDGQQWQKAESMRVGQGARRSHVVKPLSVWQTDNSRDAGYLAAAFDGEGWLDGEKARAIHKAGFAQKDNEMLAKVRTALVEREVQFREHPHASGFSNSQITNLVINTSKANLARFLGSVRPHRLLPKFTADRFGEMQATNKAALVSKVPCGEQEVIAVRTSTGTFMAEGMASHNCTYFVDYDASGVTMITWGQLKRATWLWVDKYATELHALVSKDFLQSTGRTLAGLDLATMEADLKIVTA